jgi:hypothetical protein
VVPFPYLGPICHKFFALELSLARAFETKSNQYLKKTVIVFIPLQLSIHRPAMVTAEAKGDVAAVTEAHPSCRVDGLLTK